MNNKNKTFALLITLIMLLNIFPISVFSSGSTSMSLTVSTVSGAAGDTVDVDIVIANNPGIASLKFDVAYSEDLVLEGVEFNPAFGVYATSPTPYKNPQTLTMISPLADVTANGVFATLSFSIAEDAEEGEHEVKVTFLQKDVYNSNFDDVAMTVQNGSITVEGGKPSPSETMSLAVGSASGEAGDTVEVDIVIADNPGIASLKFDVEYSDYLTLEGVVFNSAFGPYATTPPVYTNPQRITIISPFEDCTVNGTLATLTFRIASDAAEGEYEIAVTCLQNETYNSDFEDVAVNVINGYVTVDERNNGPDIDLDGDVDKTDAEAILKYITGHTVDVNEDVIDVNGDGEVNIRDVAMILQAIMYDLPLS